MLLKSISSFVPEYGQTKLNLNFSYSIIKLGMPIVDDEEILTIPNYVDIAGGAACPQQILYIQIFMWCNSAYIPCTNKNPLLTKIRNGQH